MTNEIIELLPSADLKAKIRETNHQFTEDELLQIIYRYAHTFELRLAMLERFSEVASSDVSALAKVYIEYEENNFRRFTESSKEFIYELRIMEDPYSAEEKYICSSYNAALVCIDRFYEEYADVDAKETEQTRYKITKRKVFSECDAFEEDTYAECMLGANKTVLEVSDYKNSIDCGLDNLCSECKKICPYRYDDVVFPCFVYNHAIIKYLDYKGKECFGVNICVGECDGLASEFYVIPLDSSVIRERRFEDYLDAHQHVESPLATLVAPENLEETMKKDYFDFIEFLCSREL